MIIIKQRELFFIIKGFRAIVFIFIVISTLIYRQDWTCNLQMIVSLGNEHLWPLRYVSLLLVNNNTGILNTCTRLRQTESEQVTPVDSIKDVVRSSVKVPEFDKHLKKAGGHISRNVVEITIKMKKIVWKALMIKIIKLRLRNLVD